MILYSTSKNYDGLFKEKDNGVNKKNNGATDAELIELFATKYGVKP